MPVEAFSITKEASFHGEMEKFTNVYHMITPSGTTVNYGNVLDSLLASEKKVHTSLVHFIEGRAWGPIIAGIDQDPDPYASELLAIKDYDQLGIQSNATSIYGQAALYISWVLPRSPATGRKRFLRKFIHSFGLPSGATSGMAIGSTALTTAIMNTYNLYASEVGAPLGSSAPTLCAPNGDTPTSVGLVSPVLKMRQFRRPGRTPRPRAGTT